MIEEKKVIDRVFEVLRDAYGSVNAGSTRIDVAQSTLTSAHQRGTVSFQIVASLLKHNPQISPDWLIFGIGNKYRSLSEEADRTMQYISDIRSQLERQQKELDKLAEDYNADIGRLRVNYYQDQI